MTNSFSTEGKKEGKDEVTGKTGSYVFDFILCFSMSSWHVSLGL